jgi:hypothetical protein
MNIAKSLLLDSTAALVAVSGAQAADLPVKSSLKVGGYVRAAYGWNSSNGTPTYTGPRAAMDRSAIHQSLAVRLAPSPAPHNAIIRMTSRCWSVLADIDIKAPSWSGTDDPPDVQAAFASPRIHGGGSEAHSAAYVSRAAGNFEPLAKSRIC